MGEQLVQVELPELEQHLGDGVGQRILSLDELYKAEEARTAWVVFARVH